MKYIEKQQEPCVFTNWKAQANDDWQPKYEYLSGEIKKAVKDTLMSEQGYICCYCERRLTKSDSHIEHFRPQRICVVSFPAISRETTMAYSVSFGQPFDIFLEHTREIKLQLYVFLTIDCNPL